VPSEFTAYKNYNKTMLEMQERKVGSTYPVIKFIRVLAMDSDRRVRDDQMRYLQLLCSGSKK